MVAINIEQIGVFVFGWFAVGFLVAFVLGKIFWKVNRVDDGTSYANEPLRKV